jgi:hypothetical protein
MTMTSSLSARMPVSVKVGLPLAAAEITTGDTDGS